MDNGSIDNRLLFAGSALSNAKKEILLSAPLAEYGYTGEKLDAGMALYTDAQDKQIVHKKEYGDKYNATSEMKKAKMIASRVYMKQLKVARVAFIDDPGAAQALQLGGSRLRTLSGWLSQVKPFYGNSIDKAPMLVKFQEYGITNEKLKAVQVLVTDCDEKYTTLLKESGEAQTATLVRNQAMDALDTWMGKFITIARVALEENPQYLEMLGIVVPE